MRVISVRNVHQAYPEAIRLLKEEGISQDSRNGPVIVAPFPVTTVYSHPWERVIFWPQRDANPFLHLYESLWMLAGRNDLAPLLRFTKQFAEYSDNGETLHDAYGYRWKRAFGIDQLELIVLRLQSNPKDRRCVLQMWDVHADLGAFGKAVPCNLVVTFQRDWQGKLDMVVFNRSNDIIWGAYGANAVHFSMLQEYMALKIGCPMGTYHQVSVNWHAYKSVFEKMEYIPPNQGIYGTCSDPYSNDLVYPVFLTGDVDEWIKFILRQEPFDKSVSLIGVPEWVSMTIVMFRAHYQWTCGGDQRFDLALKTLRYANPKIDWIAAGLQWIQRRKEKFEAEGGKK